MKTPIDVKKYPISRCKSNRWVFVKNVRGYDKAVQEAGRLQTNNKRGWQYRIWDNR